MLAQVVPMASKDQSARIAADVLRMAKTITSIRGGQIGKLISDTCRPIFKRILEAAMKSGEIIPKREPDEET